ncbi:MAG: hypothetical protein CM1200mP16_16990 [Nitrospina sp.]|nr:MAG: hypothetical protein CM1200mP16_16990 [Nitrospina sp.]
MPSREIGIHAHNNQQLAFANPIEASLKDKLLDGTFFGIGRAAGNCLLNYLGFLKNPNSIFAYIKYIRKDFVKLREEIEWGYTIPYMITGILDCTLVPE